MHLKDLISTGTHENNLKQERYYIYWDMSRIELSYEIYKKKTKFC